MSSQIYIHNPELKSMEKPILILIGEAHPSGIEQLMAIKGLLHARAKGFEGWKKLVVDRSSCLKGSKESIRSINEEIIKKEAGILKKEKIRRLLLERPSSPEAKRLYAEFRETHDLKRLRAGLRRENERLNADTIRDIKGFFQEVGLPAPLLEAFAEKYGARLEDNIQPMFALSHVAAAYTAGIFDIVPLDDEDMFRQAGMLPDAMYLLEGALRSFLHGHPDGGRGRDGKGIRGQVRDEYLRVAAIADKRIARVDIAREKAMCRNIVENYVPGCALLCGLDHLKPLEKELSRRFALRIYRVGERLFRSLEPE